MSHALPAVMGKTPPAADYLTISECRTLARRFMAVMDNLKHKKIDGDQAAALLQQLNREALVWAQTA